MSKRDEFVAFISSLKAVSRTITDEQRKGLLRQATLEYEVHVDDAVEILQAAGLVVGQNDNYFEILDISSAELNNLSEDAITTQVNASHKKLYTTSLAAGGLPRSDGRSQEQWRNILNEARDTLIDPEKRREYIATLQQTDEHRLDTHSLPTKQISDVTDVQRQEISHDNLPDGIVVPEGMVFIPDGEFQMGSDDEEAFDDEHPVHDVFLDAYMIDIYPVTNSEFRDFIYANPRWGKIDSYGKHIPIELQDGNYLRDWEYETFPNGKADHPVTQVSWYAAMAYAQWVGKRLPTEAEWEKAARGGVDGKKYPWGDSISDININTDDTTPIGNTPANGYGLYDMSGNVWEWCLDTYDSDFYFVSPPNNPFSGTNNVPWVVNNFTEVREPRVLRGGPWGIDSQGVRVSHRFSGNPTDTFPTFGFRCVMDVKT